MNRQDADWPVRARAATPLPQPAIRRVRHALRLSGRPTPLVVLGMHRSGTSAVAGVLHALGVQFGERLVPPAPENNEKGFWEHRDVVEVHEHLLGTLGSAWHDLRPLPSGWTDSATARHAEAELVRILERDFGRSPLWGLKDPRMCRLLPLWRRVFARLRVRPGFIIVWRHPLDAALSLARRDGFSTARGLSLWLTHMLAAESETRGCPRALVCYEDLFPGWREAMLAVSGRLGFRWPMPRSTAQRRVEAFLDQSLWHHRSVARARAEAELPPWVEEAARLLKRLALAEGAAVERRLSALTSRLEAALRLFGPEVGAFQDEPEMAQLYVPHEDGYSEERSLRTRFAANSPEVLRFRVPPGVLGPSATLRLDPTSEVGLVSIGRVVMRDGEGRTLLAAETPEALAGIEVGGTSFRLPQDGAGLRILSFGDDPHLYLPTPANLSPGESLDLEIAVRVDRNGLTLPEYVRWLRTQNEAEQALIEGRVAEERARAQAELAAVRQQAEGLKTERAALERQWEEARGRAQIETDTWREKATSYGAQLEKVTEALALAQRLAETLAAEQRAHAEALAAEKRAHAEALAARQQAHADALTAERQAHAEELAAEKRAHAEALAAERHAHADALAAERQAYQAAAAGAQASAAVLSAQLRAYGQTVESLSAQVGSLANERAAVEQRALAAEQLAEALRKRLVTAEHATAESARKLEEARARLDKLSGELADREKGLAAVSSELAAIRQSSLWAVASRLQALAGRRAPLGTWRYRALKRLGSALRLLVTEGIAGLGRRTVRTPPLLGQAGPLSHPSDTLQVGIDAPWDDPIAARGVVLRISGWCYHPRHRIRKLWLLGTGEPVPASYGMPRPDVHAVFSPDRDPNSHAMNSGFAAEIALRADLPRTVPLSLRAALSGGGIVETEIGTLRLQESPSGAAPRAAESPASTDTPSPAAGHLAGPTAEPLVAICMATYNPPLDLFHRQVASLVAQTHGNWICIVNDDCSRPDLYEQMRKVLASDRRIRLYRNAETLGFYHNFEAVLRRVPERAAFVCLADQDDVWHADKLTCLLRRFGDDTQLVYADMNILDESGSLVSPTYWTTRRNNHNSLESLLLANTVTGAASMFRRSLLEDVLPFPARIGDSFHDHWIACVALTKGRIGYVDRPLHDYIQHDTQVLGHTAPRPRGPVAKARMLVAGGFRALTSRTELRQLVQHGRLIYWNDVSRVKLIAATLLERLPRAALAKRSLLGRYARLDRSPAVWARLVARGARELVAVKETTVLAELRLLHGLLGHGVFRFREMLRRPRRAAVRAARAMLGESRTQVEGGIARVEMVEQKIAPLRLEPRAQAPKRINLLIPTIDFQVFFGGYIAKLHLALRLSREGYRVRIVLVDHCEVDLPAWRRQLQEFDQLAGVLDAVELHYAFDRSRPLEVSEADTFVASTWWTAHIAHRACRELNQRRFVYLVQEYEPFTFPMSTLAALAIESYSFPHHALFSTELLRDYFEQNALGVFAAGAVEAGARAFCFRNAITEVGPVRPEDIENRWPRRLLFYARPESHASRNMFEMGVLALSRAIERGAFDGGGWEFYGIGAAGPSCSLPLPGGRALRVLPRLAQRDYGRVLRAHDLGLALMLTPHPSLVPIEMASAGMVVVTNTFACKTRRALEAISGNLMAVEPSISALADALLCAVHRLDDHEERAREATVRWSRTWEEAFPQALVQAVGDLLGPP